MKKTTEDLMKALENSNIKDFLYENTDELIAISLHKYLENLITEKQLIKAEIIKNSNLNIQYAYQIFEGKKKPSRNKLLQLIIGMKLDLKTAQRTLKIAGVSELYPRNKRDCVIIYAINHSLSLIECNEMLFDLDLELLA